MSHPRITRRRFLRRIAAFSSFATLAPIRLKFPDEGLHSVLSTKIPEVIKLNGVPGLSISLVEDARIVWIKGFGVKKNGTLDPVLSDTVFEAASLSKPVFAAIVLGMAERKLIDLDAHIGEFFRFPDFMDDPTVDLITPRIVLSHQTGLQNWRPAREKMKFQFKPGEGFSYSGESYVRLQRAVERIAGKSLNHLAEEYIFEPLQMKESSFVWRHPYLAAAAEGHESDGTVHRTRLWEYSSDSPAARRMPPGVDIPLFAVPNAAASLYSTAGDYARFLAALLESGKTSRWLSPETIDRMLQPVSIVNERISWCLGIGLEKGNRGEYFWQWGDNDIYQGFAIMNRKQQSGLVILTNSAHGLRVCKEIVPIVFPDDHAAFSWRMVRAG